MTGAVKPRALKPGEKWPTDEALRKGMDSVRSAVVAAQADAVANRLDAAGYNRLADALDQQLAAIVRTCKLTPEAVAYYGGQSFEYVAFMNIGGFTLSPEEGRRQFVCYIRPPMYRTVDSLADAPWPWEVSPPAEEPFP